MRKVRRWRMGASLGLLAASITLGTAAGCENGQAEPEHTTPSDQTGGGDYYIEKYRPQYHLSPEKGNLSDPNGMVFFEGEYHQFYQFTGKWGHAVSKDLLHWEHLPVALNKDLLGDIWSGSAVVDWKDTSGFFGGKPGLVAIFTHFKSGLQSQSLAYSSDNGRTWTKYEGNPVLPNPGLKDFRDPKVIWHEPTQSWVMVVSVDQKIRFYTSPDLKQWTLQSEFGAGQGSHAAVWECPDLFELPVEGTDETRWVLHVSIGNNPHTNGSTAQYFVGTFDGKTFKNDNDPDEVLWTDYGKDFYAAVSYSDIPKQDGRRIWAGWMSNWRYPFDMPTWGWKGNLSTYRELKLRDIPGAGIRLVQAPLREYDSLRDKPVQLKQGTLKAGHNPASELTGTSFEWELEWELLDDKPFGLKVGAEGDRETVILIDPKEGELTVDRTRSGGSDFEPRFAEKVSAPIRFPDNKVKLRVYMDVSTLEVFANDGETVLTSIIFPDPADNGLELFTEGQVKVGQNAFYPMKSVWRAH